MRLEYIVPIVGTSQPDTITQEDLDSYFYSELYISEIKVSSAEAIVRSQTFTERDSVEVDADDKVLYTAEIEEGMVHLDIVNQLEVSADLDITLFNLVDMSGEPKVVTAFLEKKSAGQLDINIGGYRLQHHENPGLPVTHFYYRVKATTVPTDDQPDPYVKITSEDSVIVDFSMDSTYVSSFEGVVDPTEIEIDPITRSDLFDVSQIEGSPVLDDLVLTLNLYNEINFDIEVDLKVAGYHYDENLGQITDSVIIFISRNIQPGMTGDPQITSIVLDKASTTPSIVDLMAILPTDLELTGKAVVQGQGSASADDRIWAEYFLESPLKVRFDDPILFEGEIDSIGQDDLDEDERDDIDKRFTQITANLNVINGLPLGTSVKLFIGTDSTSLFEETITDSSEKIIISEEIEAGTVGSNGFVSAPKEGIFRISLSDTQISVIKNKQLFYATKIEIHPTTTPVSFREKDQVRVEGSMTIEMRMNPEDE
jgi:hypothetical protein